MAERARRSTEGAAKIGRSTVRQRCQSLYGFVVEAWPILEPKTPFVHGWVIKAICDHLEAITTGRFVKMGLNNWLIINVPPGMMKSLLVSVFWPAWEWGPAGMAHLRYVTTSYSEDYATRDSRKMRDLVESEWYQSLWGSTVQLTRRGEGDIANTARGERKAISFMSLTGGRGERLLIDDPISAEQAESDADMKKAKRITTETVPSRQNDLQTSAIVIIMQRLHENDPTGIMLELGIGYIHLMLPMEFEEDRRCFTPIFTDPRVDEGELLFPERFPAPAVAKLKIPLGTYGTAGQLQQRPSPRGGLMFKRDDLQIIEAIPVGNWFWCRGWDLAASLTDGSPYTCGVKLGIEINTKLIVIADVIRERVENALPLIQQTAVLDTVGFKQCAISIPQDPGQAGKVQARGFVANLVGYEVYTSPESGDKITRARPLQSQTEAKNVKLLKGLWNEAYIGEMTTFPTAKFKDQVDATSRAFEHVTLHPPPFAGAPLIVHVPRQPSFGDHPEALPFGFGSLR